MYGRASSGESNAGCHRAREHEASAKQRTSSYQCVQRATVSSGQYGRGAVARASRAGLAGRARLFFYFVEISFFQSGGTISESILLTFLVFDFLGK